MNAAADAVRAHSDVRPRVGIVLGTGLGGLADRIDVSATVPFADIPGMPASSVSSHAGQLLWGTLAGVPVVALQGRAHRYEGHAPRDLAFGARLVRALGADVFVVSNAAGGLNPLWARGDVMLIADHLNLTGDNPLSGPNDEALGARFPDMSAAYDEDLRATALEAARTRHVTVREGVYAALEGPNYETRAEYRMLRALGADVVGMSTVPEVIAARHAGLRVLGLSVVTDLCLPDALEPASHDEIADAARRAEPVLADVVIGVMERLTS